MLIVIYLFALSTFYYNVCCKPDSEIQKAVRPCLLTPCNESDLIECGSKGSFWTIIKNKSETVCVCCPTEQESQRLAGSKRSDLFGIYYGKNTKVCESLHLNEGNCQSRKMRDCNHKLVTHQSLYIGCFLCRPRCTSNLECLHLGRKCGLHSKEQPVKSCTGFGSGSIPGNDSSFQNNPEFRKKQGNRVNLNSNFQTLSSLVSPVTFQVVKNNHKILKQV